MMRKLFSVLFFAVAAGIAAAAEPPQSVIDAAKAKIPAAAALYGCEEERDEYELHFRDADGAAYKVEVNKFSGKVSEVKIDCGNAVSARVVLSKGEVKSLVLAAYPDARRIKVELERERGGSLYEAEFVTTDFKAEIEVNPATGEFCGQKFEYFRSASEG